MSLNLKQLSKTYIMILEYFVSLKNKAYMYRIIEANKKEEAIDTAIKDNIDSNNAEHLPLFEILNMFDGSLYSCKLCNQMDSKPFGTMHFYKQHNVDEYYTVIKEILEAKSILDAFLLDLVK